MQRILRHPWRLALAAIPLVLAFSVEAGSAPGNSGASGHGARGQKWLRAAAHDARRTKWPNHPLRRARNHSAVPMLNHVVVIVLENRSYDEVFNRPEAPTFNRLARQFASLPRYYGVSHPSLPNYIGLVSGSTQGITSDCSDCTVDARNLADTVEASGRTWKTYAEGLPSPGWTGYEVGRYVKKHNPFLYFRDVLDRPGRLARVVPLTRLSRDLQAGTLPNLSLIVPDECHNTHDCPVSDGDSWLESFLPPLLANRQLNGNDAVFVIFDEGLKSDHAFGGGHTYGFVVGPAVQPESRSTQRLDHYSLLRTIEDSWGLQRLGRSGSAEPMLGIWRDSF